MSTTFNLQVISNTGSAIEVFGSSDGCPDTVLGVLNKWFVICQGVLDADKFVECFYGIYIHPESRKNVQIEVTNQYQGDYEYIIDYRGDKPTLTIKCHDEYVDWVKQEDRIIHPCTYIANSFRRSCQADGYKDVMHQLQNLKERCGIELVEMED